MDSSTCTGSSCQPAPHHSHISSSTVLHSALPTQLHFLSHLSTTYSVFPISLSHICSFYGSYNRPLVVFCSRDIDIDLKCYFLVIFLCVLCRAWGVFLCLCRLVSICVHIEARHQPWVSFSTFILLDSFISKITSMYV